MPLDSIDTLVERLQDVAPEGFNFGFHIRFSRPSLVKITYDPEWSRHYSAQGFILMDPAVIWGLQTDGFARWSDIKIPDTLGVFSAAEKFGYRYGAAFGLGNPDSRSLGSCGRSDRQFSKAEMREIYSVLEKIHAAVEGKIDLKPHQRAALELFGQNLTYDEICAKLDISRTALKGRLAGARRALGAQNNHEAYQMALEQGKIRSAHYTGIVKGLPSNESDTQNNALLANGTNPNLA